MAYSQWVSDADRVVQCGCAPRKVSGSLGPLEDETLQCDSNQWYHHLNPEMAPRLQLPAPEGMAGRAAAGQIDTKGDLLLQKAQGGG